MTDHPEAQADEAGDEARTDRVGEERQDAEKRDRERGDEDAPTQAHAAPPTEAIILKSSD